MAFEDVNKSDPDGAALQPLSRPVLLTCNSNTAATQHRVLGRPAGVLSVLQLPGTVTEHWLPAARALLPAHQCQQSTYSDRLDVQNERQNFFDPRGPEQG